MGQSIKMEEVSLPGTCAGCTAGSKLDFEFTMAYQPIVELHSSSVFSYEALVRGIANEPAPEILAKVNSENRYRFDQACRAKAITLAAKLGVTSHLNINFLPNAVYRPEACIQSTLAAARQAQFPIEKIIFEVTEAEFVLDHGHLAAIFKEYKRQGFNTAIDDFGAGYSGLNLLADFQPDFIKLDMALIRNIDRDRARKAIVKGICGVCLDLDIRVIAEGVETHAELSALRELGINLIQGYLFARPAFEELPSVNWCAVSR